MKVLLTFVGNQDPFSESTNEEGSIITLCRFIQPNVVYLLPTASGLDVKSDTEEHASLTKDWIKTDKDFSNSIQVFIKPIRLIDPINYNEILPKVRQQLGDIIAELAGQEYELHLNCSSGTPQLKTTWLILANAGFFSNCHLWQVANPKYKKPEDRISELEITFLEEENILQRLKRFTKESFFQGIAEECGRLKEITCYSYRKEKAELMERIFLAYQCWDLIRYKEAYQGLYSVLNQISKIKDLETLREVIEKQVDVLSRLQTEEKEETQDNLSDLYFNARRRYSRGDYTDTLSRFWRVYEGTLFAYLRTKYSVEPTNLKKSENQKNGRLIKEYLRNIQGNRLTMTTAKTILGEVFKDSKFKEMENRIIEVKRGETCQRMLLKRVIEDLRDRRNYSIVAHGMEPVIEEDAANSLVAMETVLNTFFDNCVSKDYPLSEKNLLIILSVLENAYRIALH